MYSPLFWVSPMSRILLVFGLLFTRSGYGQQRQMQISHRYLNIPVGAKARMKLIELRAGGKLLRKFPVQLAEDSISYWIYIDVSECKQQLISIIAPAKQYCLERIYQDDKINGSDSLYKERNRPQFHFTVKRGWSNDINGPVFFQGQYHLFWQAFPFGLSWNTGFMYWGHAVSKDLLHWEELAPALMLDSLGSPWSGTAVVDHHNDGGWGRDALVLYYCCYDRISFKQVQCIAYSIDGGRTFHRYQQNPVIDSNWELESNDTRDPKVFWHEPSHHWVMVLFEKDGMSFYSSTDMRKWNRESHIKDLYECPDFFELPVEGHPGERKWVLHGGSSEYYIGSFDGRKFLPETEKLSYAEGKNDNEEDILYAAQSFENMPGQRRVQMAWGRITHPGMPFTQMVLFPTEFSLKMTSRGLRLVANPIQEIAALHQQSYHWQQLSAKQANEKLSPIKPGPLHARLTVTLSAGHVCVLRYQGNEFLRLLPKDLPEGIHFLDILIDKTVAEIFIDHGERYLLRQLPASLNDNGLEFDSPVYGPEIQELELFTMQSIWL